MDRTGAPASAIGQTLQIDHIGDEKAVKRKVLTVKRAYRLKKCAFLALVVMTVSLGIPGCQSSSEPPGGTNQPPKAEHPGMSEHPK